MRKCIICIWMVAFLLTGCTNAEYNSEVVLSEIPGDEGSSGISDTDNGVFNEEEVAIAESTVDEPETVVVYVCGEVKCPGVYEIPGDSRINDAVEAAGGFSENAEETYVNLAAPVSDGTKLKIPSKEEIGDTDIESFDDGSNDIDESSEKGLININKASKEELKSIPGIGDGIAGKILDYREKNGKFSCIEDIMKVSGIKEKLFAKIKDYITV